MSAQATKTLIDRLPAHTTGAALAALIGKLRDGSCRITLDASRVETLDPTGLEGLLVISATQRTRGHGFELEQPSDAFLSDLTLFGANLEQLKGPTQ